MTTIQLVPNEIIAHKLFIYCWLSSGLDNVIAQYNTSFLNNAVTGHQLLSLRADDLEHLGVKTLGHQEIILEAVEHLRTFVRKQNLNICMPSYYFLNHFSILSLTKKIYKL